MMSAQQGLSEWDEIGPPTNIKITVDANQQTGTLDHVSTVVHELLHVLLVGMCIGWLTEEVEEVVILALDDDMMKYIRKSPARFHKWEEGINSKLKQTEERSSA